MTERSEADWNELAAEGQRNLRQVARSKGLIDYKDFNRELAESTGLPTFELATERGRADISQLLVRIHVGDYRRMSFGWDVAANLPPMLVAFGRHIL